MQWAGDLIPRTFRYPARARWRNQPTTLYSTRYPHKKHVWYKIHIKRRAEQISACYAYTVKVWPGTWPAAGAGAARNGVGRVMELWPEGPLASSSCSWANPRPCNGVCEELRRESWGFRRKRDAGALETGGREGFRLDKAFFGTPGW